QDNPSTGRRPVGAGLLLRAVRGPGGDPSGGESRAGEGAGRLACPETAVPGAGAPSALRFGAAGHGSGNDRPVRRLIGAPTAPPLPCCAVTDHGFPARAARGPARRYAQRPQPAQVQGGAAEVRFVAHLRHAAEPTQLPRIVRRRPPLFGCSLTPRFSSGKGPPLADRFSPARATALLAGLPWRARVGASAPA